MWETSAHGRSNSGKIKGRAKNPQTMKKQTKAFIAALITLVLAALFTLKTAAREPEPEPTPEPLLTHEQTVWMHALQWCESHGNGEAINKVDKDGTPSYYWYQFKPGTFRQYGEKYLLIETGKSDEEIMELMKNYELTYSIMEHMVADPTITAKQWRYSLFPGCTAKLGTPPRVSTDKN